MLTKPQAFYDNIHKQALGYQNPFHVKKAQQIKPTLYDGNVMSDKHVAMPVIDNEETLILEDESRLKIKPSDALPIKIEASKELPKISLVNESLKKLKFHLCQLNQDIFQKNESCNNQNALKILEFFENNNLKAQLQDKDSTICKLKDIIKSKREKSKEENVKYAYCDIETKNVELENSVVKLISENEHLCNEINHVKQVFKEQFDLIKKTRVRTKEHSDSLIDKLNLKSAENEDLKAQIQDKTIDSEPDCFYRYEYGSRTDRCGMGGAIGGESDLDVCWGRMLVSKMGGYNAYRCRESGCSRCSSESGCFKILVIEMGIFGVFRIFGMEMFVAARAGGQTKEKDVAYLQTQLLSVKIGRSRKYNSKLKRLIDQRTLQQFLIEIEERQCKTVFLYCICIASIDIGTQTVNSPVYDFRRIS
ncbi:hypothetical protein Tco_0544115 [Tanacetum coccineum]